MPNTLIQQSERAYAFLLKFYPKPFRKEFGQEMQFVFSESLKSSYSEHHEPGVISLWGKTIIDVLKSLTTQYLEKQKGTMKNSSKNAQRINFKRVLLATAAAIVIPMLGSLVSSEWNWDETDFIVIGVLVFTAAMLFEFVTKKVSNPNHRILVGLAVIGVALLIFVELAVGLFGTPFAGN